MAPAVDSRKNGDLQPYNLRALSSNRQILWQSSSLYSPWLWVPTADSFCLSVSHHVPDTLWNRSKACEAWTRSGVRFLPTPPGSQSSLIFCFFFVENSEGSLIVSKCLLQQVSATAAGTKTARAPTAGNLGARKQKESCSFTAAAITRGI